jgi:hypothetical protein
MDLSSETNRVQVIVSYRVQTSDGCIEGDHVPFYVETNKVYRDSPIFREIRLVRVNPVADELESFYALVKRKTEIRALVTYVRRAEGFTETAFLPGDTEECTITINDTTMQMGNVDQ